MSAEHFLILKRILACGSLGLWVLSLFLPVFEEGGAGRGNLISGSEVLLFTFAWGIFVIIGIPWAVVNVGLLVLFAFNVQGKSSRRIGATFASLIAVLTVVVLATARDYPQWNWHGADTLRIGFVVWTAAMFLMAAATCMTMPDRADKQNQPDCPTQPG